MIRKLTVWILAGLLSFACINLAWGGGFTTNGFIYKPDLGARGVNEKLNFDSGMDRVDLRLGKEIWVGDPNYGSTLQDAISAIGGNVAILKVPPGNYTIPADLNIPVNICLKVERGATLSVADGKTLTINGGLDAGLYQAFSCSGTGKVVFGPGAIKAVYPEWWGVLGNNTDESTALQAMFTAAGGVAPIKLSKGKIYKGKVNLASSTTLQGNSATFDGRLFVDGISNLIIEDVNFINNWNVRNYRNIIVSYGNSGNYGNFLFNRCTFSTSYSDPDYHDDGHAISLGGKPGGELSNITINNCTFKDIKGMGFLPLSRNDNPGDTGVHVHNITVRDCRFINITNTDAAVPTFAISLDNIDTGIVDGCYFENVGQRGIEVAGSNNVSLTNNTFNGVDTEYGSGGVIAFAMGTTGGNTNSSNCVISGNQTIGNNNGNILLYNLTRSVVSDNVFKLVDNSVNIFIGDSSNNIISGNYFETTKNSCLAISNSGSNRIVNNTISNANANPSYNTIWLSGASTTLNIIANNTIIPGTGQLYWQELSGASNNNLRNNFDANGYTILSAYYEDGAVKENSKAYSAWNLNTITITNNSQAKQFPCNFLIKWAGRDISGNPMGGVVTLAFGTYNDPNADPVKVDTGTATVLTKNSVGGHEVYTITFTGSNDTTVKIEATGNVDKYSY